MILNILAFSKCSEVKNSSPNDSLSDNRGYFPQWMNKSEYNCHQLEVNSSNDILDSKSKTWNYKDDQQ